MTRKKMAEWLDISEATLRYRLIILGIEPKKRIGNDYQYTFDDFKKVANFHNRTEILEIETTYYIYPSKLNYLEV
jgi:hypothetical protein